MDPDACLALIFDHLEDGDYESAHDSCLDLKGWLARGGFEPTPYMTLKTPSGETAYNIDDLRGFLRITMDNCKRRSI
jgi:hypothetical protein